MWKLCNDHKPKDKPKRPGWSYDEVMNDEHDEETGASKREDIHGKALFEAINESKKGLSDKVKELPDKRLLPLVAAGESEAIKGLTLPTVVCLCGSTRFRDEFIEANRRETMTGRIVLAPGVFMHSGDHITDDDKRRLDELHLRKIDMASHVLVINPGGYIGESTRREIAYARATGKSVEFTHKTEEIKTDKQEGENNMQQEPPEKCKICDKRRMSDCTHHSPLWEWHSKGCHVVPAYIVYCSDCNEMLFTTIYDAEKNEHRISVPNFHTIKWQEYIVDVFRKKFPNDRIIISPEDDTSNGTSHRR
jgi:hypothetical protein